MQPAHKSQLTGTLCILGAVITWGAYFPFAKIVLQTISPASFLIIRLGVGAASLYLLNLTLKKNLRINRADWVFVVLAGIVGIILHQLIQLAGLKQTSATNTAWILTLNPPVAGLLGWLVLKENVSARKIVGLVIAMLGAALLVSRGHLDQLSFINNWGDALAFISIGTWSLYILMMKSRLTKYEPLGIAALHMCVGFVFFAAVGGAEFSREMAAMSSTDWTIAILIGIIPSGLAYYWWTTGLQRLSMIDISMFLFIEAIVASLTGWVVLGESFTFAMVIGAIVIVGGVMVAQTRRLGKVASDAQFEIEADVIAKE